MTVRTRAQLLSDADTYLTTNGAGEITGTILNQRVKDLADSAVLPEDTPLTTRGDMLRRGAGAPERFAKGAEGRILGMGANDPDWVDRIVTAADVALTSQSSAPFTGIPDWAKVIEIALDGVQWNGSSLPLVQLGTSGGGYETTGYSSASGSSDANGSATSTAGFVLRSASSANVLSGVFTLKRKGTTNLWMASGQIYRSDGSVMSCAGRKTAAGVVDRVRFTNAGSDTGTAGAVGLRYY